MHLNSGKRFKRRSLFSTFLNSVVKCHYSKFQRLLPPEITRLLWSNLFLCKTLLTTSLGKAVLPMFLSNLSSSILCPHLFRNLAKKRLISDLRHVNQFLYWKKFRCQHLRITKEILNPADYISLLKVGLLSRLYIHPDH